MQSLAPAKDFAPAGRAGSCLGPPSRTELEVSTSLKGIRAEWVWDESTRSNRFRHPLRLTSVAPGSEADRTGLKAGDIVLAVSRDRDAFVEVTATAVSFCPGSFVPEEVNAMLLGDRVRVLRIAQRHELACSQCGQFTVEESLDSLDHCLVCTACGGNASDSLMSIDEEWRTFFADEQGADPTRVGPAVALDEPTGSTWTSGCAQSVEELARAHVSAIGAATRTASEQVLQRMIMDLCRRMDLSGRIPTAAQEMGSKFLAARERQGVRRMRLAKEAVAAACVYAACNELGVHRTMKEMVEGARWDAKQVKSAVALVGKMVPRQKLAVDAGALLTRFCRDLRLPMALEASAHAALSHLPASFASRHLPSSLAAAAISRASGLCPSQLTSVTGAAASTIRNLAREWDALQHQLPRAGPLALAELPPPPPNDVGAVEPANDAAMFQNEDEQGERKLLAPTLMATGSEDEFDGFGDDAFGDDAFGGELSEGLFAQEGFETADWDLDLAGGCFVDPAPSPPAACAAAQCEGPAPQPESPLQSELLAELSAMDDEELADAEDGVPAELTWFGEEGAGERRGEGGEEGPGRVPSKEAMEEQLQQHLKVPFCINDNAYRRLAAFHRLLHDAEAAGVVSVSVAARQQDNCVVGFRHVRVHRIADFNARVRGMIEADPDGIWKKVNGKGAVGLKLPTAPLYEVLRKIGVRPAGARESGGKAGEEDRFWRAEWVYKPESLTAKTAERMKKGHEYSPTLSSAVRKQALKAHARSPA